MDTGERAYVSGVVAGAELSDPASSETGPLPPTKAEGSAFDRGSDSAAALSVGTEGASRPSKPWDGSAASEGASRSASALDAERFELAAGFADREHSSARRRSRAMGATSRSVSLDESGARSSTRISGGRGLVNIAM